MPKELIDQKFNEVLWRFEAIEPVSAELEAKLRIAFQEGVIKAQEYLVDKLNKVGGFHP